MTKKEKAAILEKSAIAYYSGFSGIEIKEIESGIEDYVIFVAGAWCSAKSVHRAIIKSTTSGNLYFCYKGNRIPLNDCIRCNAF